MAPVTTTPTHRHRPGDPACYTSQQGRRVCTCPHRTPQLDQANSDGSCAHSSSTPAQDRPIFLPPWDSFDWVDELKAWLAIGVISAVVLAAIFIAAGFLVGISWHR